MLQILLDGASQNHKMIQKLQDLHTIIRMDKEIPAQVLLSKPAILLDARGRFCPFHLEFIDSADVCIISHCLRTGLHSRTHR